MQIYNESFDDNKDFDQYAEKSFNKAGITGSDAINLKYSTNWDKVHDIRNKTASAYNQAVSDYIGSDSYKNSHNFLTRGYHAVKTRIDRLRDWIAKWIDKANTWARKIEDKLDDIPKEKQGFFHFIKRKLIGAVERLTRLLHNLMAANRRKLEEPAKIRNDRDDFFSKVELGKESRQINETIRKHGYGHLVDELGLDSIEKEVQEEIDKIKDGIRKTS